MKHRKKDRHLPSRVYLKSGSYYYVDQKNKWYLLGKDFVEAMAEWAKIAKPVTAIMTMQQLFDRYMLEVAPHKAPATYHTNKMQIRNLYEPFGELPPSAITPVHVYQFLEKRGKIAPIAANREKALLSHVFSMAIKWGIVSDNPCRNVKRLKEVSRDRYITHQEFWRICKIAPHHIKNIIQFAYLTGMRQADILKLKHTDLHTNGIFVKINKTGNKILIEWSPRLRALVRRISRIKSRHKSEFLFNNKNGKPYTSSGFQSIWQKLIVKAIEDKIIEERFNFHDIRRKTASDMEETMGRENARKLLGHADQKTTNIYISGTQKVKPLK